MSKKKIYRTNDLYGIGVFAYPILEFNERLETAKQTTPQMSGDLQALAARVYFGMLAEQPKPTREDECYYIDWESSGVDKKEWLELEEDMKYSALPILAPHLRKTDAQTAYFSALKNLQSWLAYYGLTEGIQKTLMEASRKRQADLAAIAASNAAAARALAFSKVTADMTEEARIEAAENEARARKTLDENLTKEAEIKQDLENIKNGYLVEKTGGSVWPWLLLGAGAFFALGKSKGKKAVKV
jgi:hypothetical protein